MNTLARLPPLPGPVLPAPALLRSHSGASAALWNCSRSSPPLHLVRHSDPSARDPCTATTAACCDGTALHALAAHAGAHHVYSGRVVLRSHAGQSSRSRRSSPAGIAAAPGGERCPAQGTGAGTGRIADRGAAHDVSRPATLSGLRQTGCYMTVCEGKTLLHTMAPAR